MNIDPFGEVIYAIIAAIFLISIALAVIAQIYVCWIQIFAWETRGKKIFKNMIPEHLFASTKKLAANQGVYNLFFAVGLALSLYSVYSSSETSQLGRLVVAFFLLGIAITGIYGAKSSSKKIFYIQALPAIIALLMFALLYVVFIFLL